MKRKIGIFDKGESKGLEEVPKNKIIRLQKTRNLKQKNSYSKGAAVFFFSEKTLRAKIFCGRKHKRKNILRKKMFD